jgi:putative glycosyltransferase (TIGR04348 family)
MSSKPHLVIITPGLAAANNGNWHTASRWAHFLAERFTVSVMKEWDGVPAAGMIALHARKSAASVAAFAGRYPASPVVLVLTGTDLYRDIHSDEQAKTSLHRASRLVVLQEAGLRELTTELRAKACVIYQSSPPLPRWARADGYFKVITIGHLREEKDPRTFMAAARLVTNPFIRMVHIGGALDTALEECAASTEREVPCYQWLGPRPHSGTRQRLRRSQLLVLCSRMEGGANVIIEAVTSGVPVLASDIPGNRGMLGEDYPGYFAPGDSRMLATLIERAASDSAWLATLAACCAGRARLFTPEREQAAVLRLMDNLVFRATSG